MTRTDTYRVGTPNETTTATTTTVEYLGTITSTAGVAGIERFLDNPVAEVPRPRQIVKASRKKYRRFLERKGFTVLGMVDCDMCKDSVWVAVEKDQRYQYWHADFRVDGKNHIPVPGVPGSEIYKTSGELLTHMGAAWETDSGLGDMREQLRKILE